MSLSGSIESGTVAQLFQTLSRSKRQVTLLLHNGAQFGHAQFEAGELLAVSLDDLEGDEAVEVLCAWHEGIYTIIKSQEQDQASHAHAMLVGHLGPIHKGLNPWLTKHGFQTSQIPYHQSVLEIARFIHPDVVIVTCQAGESTCHDIRSELTAELDPPPIVMLVGNENGVCAVEGAPCSNASYSIAQVKHVLATRWPRLLQGEQPLRRAAGQGAPVPQDVQDLQQDEGRGAAGSPGSDVVASDSASDSPGAAVAATAQPPAPARKTALYAVAIVLLAAGALGLYFVLGSEPPTGIQSAVESGPATTAEKPGAAQTGHDQQARAASSPSLVAASKPATAQGDAPSSPQEADPVLDQPVRPAPGAKTLAPAGAKRRPRPGRPAAGNRGTLVVQSNEVAMVSIDGIKQGKTPAELTLPVGVHRVSVSSVARPQVQQSQTIKITAASTTRVRFDFPEQPQPPVRVTPAPAKKDDNDRLPTDNIDPWAR